MNTPTSIWSMNTLIGTTMAITTMFTITRLSASTVTAINTSHYGTCMPTCLTHIICITIEGVLDTCRCAD